ncbi:MAG: hypothetical protein ACJAT7_003396 [Psychromonas sp.]|jgi:hypothetical protein|uniref:hypothetical protein n=1 Tax=Psychromonas sp. TaxID=1884585 RepID=UPI0039E6DFF7
MPLEFLLAFIETPACQAKGFALFYYFITALKKALRIIKEECRVRRGDSLWAKKKGSTRLILLNNRVSVRLPSGSILRAVLASLYEYRRQRLPT